MNLNKEERLEEVRNILIGSQFSDLHKKIAHLEKSFAGGEKAFKDQLIDRITDFEESMKEAFNLFSQHFELEQKNYKEAYQQLQTSVHSSSLKISALEKRLENQSLQEHSPSDLAEVREKLRSLRSDLNYQNIEHKNAYEHLTKSLQEFSQGWNTSLNKLEQEALKRDQALKKYLLTSSTKLSSDLQKLREMLQSRPTLKAQPAAQPSQVASELKNLEQKFLRREEDFRLEMLEQIKQLYYELNYYQENFSKELTRLYSPAFLLTRLWLWPWSMILRIWRLLNGSNRKENSL